MTASVSLRPDHKNEATTGAIAQLATALALSRSACPRGQASVWGVQSMVCRATGRHGSRL